MKTIGKILIAVVLVAMIVTSIITVALAANNYTGNLKDAQKKVDAALKVSDSDLDSKMTNLSAAYTYILRVDPKEVGYDDLMTTLVNEILRVAPLYIAAFEAVDDSDLYNKAIALEKAYNYPVIIPLAQVGAETYLQHEKSMHEKSMYLAELYVNKLLGKADSGKGLYALMAATELAEDLVKLGALEYSLPENPLFTGDVKNVSAIIASLGENSSFAELKAGLAAAYSYLAATPVNPMTEEYLEFITKYDALGDALISGFVESVDSAATADAKITQLSEFRTFLAETMISEKVVKEYNTKLDAVKAEYNSGLEDVEPLNTLFGGNYSTNITQLGFYVNMAETNFKKNTTAGTNSAMTALKTIYTNFLSKNLYDPGATCQYGTYSELIEKYHTVCEGVVNQKLINEYNAQNTLNGKISILSQFYKDREKMPFAAETYNRTRLELYEFLEKLNSQLENNKIVYSKPAAPKPTVDERVLNTLLGDITGAYDKYANADAEGKAAAFEELKTTVASMNNLLTVSVIDTQAAYYPDFFNAYDEIRLEFVNAYLAMVDSADADKKAAILGEVKSFFDKNPLSKSAIEAYNGKVEEVFAGDDAKITEFKLTSVYFEIEELLAKITPTATLKDNFDNMRVLYTYYQRDYDVTDKAYNDFVEAYEEKDKMLGDAMIAALKAAVGNANASEVASVIGDCVNYLNEVQLEQSILKFNAELQNIVTQAGAIAKRIENGDKIDAGLGADLTDAEKNDAIGSAVSSYNYDTISALIAAYANASDLDAKKAAFKAIHDELSRMRDQWKQTFEWDISFSELRAAYVNICTSLSDEIIATMADEGKDDFAKFVALKETEIYVKTVPYSEIASKVAGTYSAVLEDLKMRNVDLRGFAAQVDEACKVLDYTSPEGFENDFADFDTAIGTDVNGFQDVCNKIHSVYTILAADKYDFGVDGFIYRLEEFDGVKDAFILAFNEEVDSKEDKISKFEVFKEMREFIGENLMSKKMVDAFNAKRFESINIYTLFNETAVDLEAFINHFAKFPVVPADFENADAETYANFNARLAQIQQLIPYAKYIVVKSAIVVSDNAGGDFATLNQKRALDVMKRYSEGLEQEFCNDSVFVNETVVKMFNTVLNGVVPEDAEAFGAEIKASGYPQYLIDMYNEKFNKQLVAEEVAAGENGKLIAFVELVNQFNAATDSAEMKNVLTAIVSSLNENPINATSRYSNITSAIKRAKETYQKSVIAHKTELLNSANIIDLSFNPTAKTDGSKLTATGNYFTGGTKDVTIVGKGYSKQKQTVDAYDENGNIRDNAPITNEYYKVSYLTTAPYWWQQNGYDPNASYSYGKSNSGLVVDFDIMAPENLNFTLCLNGTDPDEDVRKDTTNYKGLGYKIYLASFKDNILSYSASSSDPEYSGYKSGTNEQIVVTPGEWTHITAIINPNDSTVELLINYVSLGKKAIVTEGTQKGNIGTEKPDMLRYTLIQVCFAETALDAGRVQKGEYCYDNIRITRGSSYHDDDQFAKMSDGEKFKYFVTRLANENDTAINRMYAYQEATALLKSIKGAAYDEYKAIYNNFDSETVTAAAYEEHYDFVEDLFANYDRVINTKNSLYNKIVFDMINEYLDHNRKYLNFSNERIMQISERIRETENRLTVADNTDALVTTLKQFYRATTLASLEIHYANVMANYAKFENRADYDLAMQDAAVTTFFNDTLLQDPYVKALKDAGTPITIDFFCLEYAPYRIEKQLSIENSKAMVDGIGFIEALVENKEELTAEQYRAALLEKAKAEVDYISPYMNAVSSILKSGKYNEEADGVAHAKEIYNLLEKMFYEITQAKHLEIIREQLEKYKQTNSYIEKLGVCQFVESYISKNNVDMSGELGAEYMATLTSYKLEVSIYKDVYATIVEQNTVAFIALVEKMESYVTYKELKPLYDEGIAKYYYSMNVNSPEAKAAIAKFDAYGEKLEAAEFNSQMFLDYVDTLKSARRQSHIYRALVNCTMYLDGVDEDVKGVTEALEIYNQKLAEYNAKIDAVNGGISDSTTVVCSLRSGSVATTVLAVIKNIFSK